MIWGENGECGGVRDEIWGNVWSCKTGEKTGETKKWRATWGSYRGLGQNNRRMEKIVRVAMRTKLCLANVGSVMLIFGNFVGK